mgnify:CR=1 FL=1|jgi:hypothetical protein|tara:strand:- start:181 stop:765 length:585 start_codon:yes stop_codon:yes gene_type:complete
MRIFIIVIFLLINFHSLTNANDISEFEIEGMSIGNSLLDHFSKSEITNEQYSLPQAINKKFLKINLENLKNIEIYDRLSATFKSSDKKYKTTSIEGIVWYRDDISSCLKKRDEIIQILSDLFINLEKENIKQKHFLDNDSFTHDYYIFFENSSNWPVDHILVSCYDWSEKLEYWDHLRIAIVTKEYMEWLETHD